MTSANGSGWEDDEPTPAVPPPGPSVEPSEEAIEGEPEEREPGTLPPVPRGYTKQEWEATFYGKRRARTSSLSFGREWLLAGIFVAVLVVLIVVIALAY